MPATDYFSKTYQRLTTTLAADKSSGASSMSLSSATNFPTTSGIKVCVYTLTDDGDIDTDTFCVYRGTVSASQVNNLTLVEGTDQLHTAGATVSLLFTATHWNDAMDGILTEHNQDGTHSDVTATTLTTSGDITATGSVTASSFVTSGGASSNGWTVGASVPTTVAYNGNGSYTLTHSSSVAATSFVGAKNRYTRTVTAPTQCANLNGTTQYFSKSSPAGSTFTTTFSAGAWVKLNSYAQGNVIGRFSATGYFLEINTAGQVRVVGLGTGGTDEANSYQSIPLNRWVHVVSTMNVTTNAYAIYINGVSVPVQTVLTACTAITQAGDFTVGARSGGTQFLPGKIAQAFVASKVLSASEVKAIQSQGIVAGDVATYQIVSAFSLSGASGLTDINTTNANNLTANGSATTTTDDTPFTQSVVGTSITAGTTNYGVTTAISSDGLTETVQTAEGDTIPTSGGISAVAYSTQGVPYGFPRDEGKWTLTTLSTSADTVTSSYTNAGNIALTIPVGAWTILGQITITVIRASADPAGVIALSESTTAATAGYERTTCVVYGATTATGTSRSTNTGNPKINKTYSSATPVYAISKYTAGSASTLYINGESMHYIEATLALL